MFLPKYFLPAGAFNPLKITVYLPFRKTSMGRYILVFLLLTGFVSPVQAQDYYDETDSSEYIPAFERDTTARVHAGAALGLHYRGITFSANPDPVFSDSIGNWSSSPQAGFSFGIVVDTRLSKHLNFVTGMNIMISKLQMSYTQSGVDFDQYTNYSTLQLPLWLNYSFSTRPDHFYLGFGGILTTDISRSDEKINRTIIFNNIGFLVGGGLGYRKRLPTYFNLNFDLQLHYSLLNLVADEANFYNEAMDIIKIWELSFYISID
jgi:hypothetical protein